MYNLTVQTVELFYTTLGMERENITLNEIKITDC